MINRIKTLPLFLFLLTKMVVTQGQGKSFDIFLADSSMSNASVSLCIINSETGERIMEHNSQRSLTPASILKLVTTAAALEILGPEYTFRTQIGYTGSLNKLNGRLSGNLVIRGGGDPALGSDYFTEHYKNFINNWISEIIKSGIKEIKGRIICDDSRYDYQPVPGKWQWEDSGNYYGAGAYGLSVFDNTCRIHFTTSAPGSVPEITRIEPAQYIYRFTNRLTSLGNSDKGYIFSAPYSNSGWLTGTIPVNTDDFILKGSIADPPMLLAQIIHAGLDSAGIIITGEPSTARLEGQSSGTGFIGITETLSPPLKEIIRILNYESVNLYAEHLLKEMGLVMSDEGSTGSGTKAIEGFFKESGIDTGGFFIKDGSGLSRTNAVTSAGMVSLLRYMKEDSPHYTEFFNSLPEAGKTGTLTSYFKDPVFDGRMKAKSGSMERVRCYAGYLVSMAGHELIFCIMINNFSGSSAEVIKSIENVLKEAILSN